ncbi:MAG TPA: hypothetical protein VF665_01615 [Longimicrobium sp.]|jgi:hypothetical protein|uniref:hypothetical protein n=1 Tax=Longimicrobium sp. TaxID=2029185 RepID=UPI002ED8C375
MEKLLVFIGTFAGGWIGWVVGQPFGMFAAIMGSMVGTGLGLYYGRKIMRDHF